MTASTLFPTDTYNRYYNNTQHSFRGSQKSNYKYHHQRLSKSNLTPLRNKIPQQIDPDVNSVKAFTTSINSSLEYTNQPNSIGTSYYTKADNMLPSSTDTKFASLSLPSTEFKNNDTINYNNNYSLLLESQNYSTITYGNKNIVSVSESFNASTMQPVSSEEFCSNSHIVSVETIISFTEGTDGVLFVFTLLSSLLQIYIMIVAVQHIRRQTADKCMHVFLFSMTFADFILTALCYPVELAPRAGLIRKFPKYVSATMHMLCWIALIVSSFSLVFLNLDKLFYFRFPLRYRNYFTQIRAITLISVCWLFSSIFVIFAWFTNSFHCVDEDCITLAIFPNRLHIYIPFMIFVGVIPTITSLIVAIYILKIVLIHRRQLAQERLLCPPVALARPNSVLMSRIRTFYFIFMTTVFTAITLLPYRFAGLQRSFNPGRMHDCLTIMLFWIMMYMIYLHSIINPLITVTVLPQYRMKFFNAILCGHLTKIAKLKKMTEYALTSKPDFRCTNNHVNEMNVLCEL